LELCPLIRDGVEQPLKVKLHSNCFDDELFHLFLEKPLFVPAARLGPFGNYGADTLVNLEPALLDQVLNGFMRCVRVDFERECQGSNGREGLSRLELAADKGLLCGENHLVDNGFAWLEVDAKSCHMDNVTPVTERVKAESDAGCVVEQAVQLGWDQPPVNADVTFGLAVRTRLWPRTARSGKQWTA
jgi:hypothetical protein